MKVRPARSAAAMTENGLLHFIFILILMLGVGAFWGVNPYDLRPLDSGPRPNRSVILYWI